MPTAVIAKDVLDALWDEYLFAGGSTFECHLFTNDITPDRNTVATDFMEAAYPGYAVVTNDYAPETAIGNQFHWTVRANAFPSPSAGPAVNVFGFYVIGSIPGVSAGGLVFSARFASAPVVLTVGGAGITINLDLRSLDLNNP